MIPQLANVLDVIKTVFESIKKFFEELVKIVKGEDAPADDPEAEA